MPQRSKVLEKGEKKVPLNQGSNLDWGDAQVNALTSYTSTQQILQLLQDIDSLPILRLCKKKQ